MYLVNRIFKFKIHSKNKSTKWKSVVVISKKKKKFKFNSIKGRGEKVVFSSLYSI